MNKPIVSTRNIDVVLAKRKRLNRVTTKDIDASIKIKKPKEDSMKSPLISTHNIGDVGEIEEKKKRVEIMAQRKGFKESDPVHLNEKGVLVGSEEEQKHVEKFMKDIDGKVFKTTEDMNLDMRDEKKLEGETKPFVPSEADDEEKKLDVKDEKKLAMSERMKKVRAAKKKKRTPTDWRQQ